MVTRSKTEFTQTAVPTAPPTASEPLSVGEIAQRIQLLRGQRVVLDSDLAAFYGQTTKRFNQQVGRNLDRFPDDFMFRLDEHEFSALRLQTATLKTGLGQHRKYRPYAFTLIEGEKESESSHA